MNSSIKSRFNITEHRLATLRLYIRREWLKATQRRTHEASTNIFFLYRREINRVNLMGIKPKFNSGLAFHFS